MDVAGKKDDVLPLFDRIEKWTNAIGDDKVNPEKYFETYYKGQYKRSENRYKLFRLYDKTTDTFTREKNFLFPHIGKVKHSQRLELELRQELCKKLPYTVLEVLESKRIQENLFSNYMEDYSSYFEKFPIEYKKFPKNSTVLDYLKPIPYSFLKQYCSFVNRIEKTCSYK